MGLRGAPYGSEVPKAVSPQQVPRHRMTYISHYLIILTLALKGRVLIAVTAFFIKKFSLHFIPEKIIWCNMISTVCLLLGIAKNQLNFDLREIWPLHRIILTKKNMDQD